MLKATNIAVPKLPSARVGAGSLRAALLTLVFLPLTLLLLENASAFNTRLAFSNETQVNTPFVYLDDIVVDYNGNELIRQKSERIIVASAPFPGKIKIIKRPQVVRALRKHDLTTGNNDIYVPEKITVTRKAKTFGIKDIESIIRTELTRKNFVDNKKSLFTLTDIQKEVVLPADNIKTIVKMPGKFRSNNKFWVSFYVNGKLKNRVWAKGSIKRNVEVLAINKSLGANKIIKEEDLVYVKKNILDLNGNYITNKRAIVGKKSVKNLREGSIFKKSSIGEPPIVKAGDTVNIQAQMKNLTINTNGVVLSAAGHKGDTINVLNVNSKEKLKAVVVSNKTVIIEVH